jgi:hypothetical protein
MPSYTRLLVMAPVCGVLLVPSPGLAQSSATERTWTLEELFQRNVGTKEQQYRAATPHKVIDNIWYVGTESLASFLATTPADPAGYKAELDLVERVFNETLDAQRKGAAK